MKQAKATLEEPDWLGSPAATFYYIKFARRIEDASIGIPISLYSHDGSHGSGGKIIPPDDTDYDFWLWMIQRQRHVESKEFKDCVVNDDGVRQAKEEYERAWVLLGTPLIDQAKAIEALPQMVERKLTVWDRFFMWFIMLGSRRS